MQGKSNSILKTFAPGPGHYDPKLNYVKKLAKRPAATKSSRLTNLSPSKEPGPGHYDSPIKFGKDSLSFKFRDKPKDFSINNNPGPSYYNPNDTVVRLSSPKYKISAS